MTHNGRSINREYSPYAVDSLEDLSKESSSFKGSHPNNSYQNLGLTRSQEDLSKQASTSKGSYQNPAYENSEISHQYEDPAYLVAAASASTGPRKKRNELYEPTDLKSKDQEANNDDYNDEIGGDTWLSRLILFLILMVSLASLLLVVLIMLGKVGTSCSSCNEEAQGEVLFNCFAKDYLTIFVIVDQLSMNLDPCIKLQKVSVAAEFVYSVQ